MPTPEERRNERRRDEAAPGTPGSGEAICPECRGNGRRHGEPCPACGGTGRIIEGIGGA